MTYYEPQPGSAWNLDRVTGRALFTPSGETGAIDLGDVKLHELKAEVRRRAVMTAGRYGIRQSRSDVVAVESVSFRVELQESLPEVLATLLFAAPATMLEQGAQVATPVALANVAKGRVYDLQVLDITSCAVAVNGVACVEGRDYELDDKDGTLRILPHGIIRDGATVVATVSSAAVRQHRLSALGATAPLQRAGTLRFTERDGRWNEGTGGPVCRIVAFPCTLSRDAEDSRDSSAFAGFSLIAIPTGKLDLRLRSVSELRRVPRGQVVTVGTRHRRISRLRVEGRFIIR